MRRNAAWFCLVILLGCSSSKGASSGDPVADLTGATWQLVKFEGADGTTLTPTHSSQYTIAFAADSRVSARIDCNRGMGAWKSIGAHQLEFGPLALTRMACPPAPLTDRITKDWTYVRTYTMKGGHLFLALMADAGIYELEPAK